SSLKVLAKEVVEGAQLSGVDLLGLDGLALPLSEGHAPLLLGLAVAGLVAAIHLDTASLQAVEGRRGWVQVAEAGALEAESLQVLREVLDGALGDGLVVGAVIVAHRLCVAI